MLIGAPDLLTGIDEHEMMDVLFSEMEYRQRVMAGLEPEHSPRERSALSPKIRYAVLKRDKFACRACGLKVEAGAHLQIDHIWPISKGGRTIMGNLQALCLPCNIGKGATT